MCEFSIISPFPTELPIITFKLAALGWMRHQSMVQSMVQFSQNDQPSPAEDLAISRKNDRTWQESLDSAERFRLTPMDFGLEALPWMTGDDFSLRNHHVNSRSGGK